MKTTFFSAAAMAVGLLASAGWAQDANEAHIYLKSSAKGTITLSADTISVGDTFNVDVAAQEGYVITQISTNGVPVEGAFGESAFDFDAIATDEAMTIAAAYARNDAWFLDPFVRNNFKARVTNENMRAADIDEENDLFIAGLAPGGSSCGVVGYNLSSLTNDFGKATPYTFYDQGARSGCFWGRGIAAVPGYKAFISCNSGIANQILVSPYEIGDNAKPWTIGGIGYSVPMVNLPPEKLTLQGCPPVVNASGTKYYTYTSNVIYQFAIVADPEDSTKIGSMVYEKSYSTPIGINNDFDVAEFDGKEFLYCSGGSAGLIVVDTATDEIIETGITSLNSTYNVNIIGQKNGTPKLVLSCGRTDVYDLNTDGTFVSETPIASFTTSDYVAKGTSDCYYANAFSKDERFAVLSSGGNSTETINLTVIEKKPETLIVRGTFNGGETTDDRGVDFGSAVSETFTAPKRFEIASVSVNGVQVAGFEQAASYTFESEALEAYVYVEMTLIELPQEDFAADDEIAFGNEVVSLTEDEAEWLNGLLENSSLGKDEYLAALANSTDNVDFGTKYLLNADPLKDTEYEFVISEIVFDGTMINVTVKLVRKDDGVEITDAINGTLKIYGAKALSGDFVELDATIDNGNYDGESEANTSLEAPAFKFFKAVIE